MAFMVATQTLWMERVVRGETTNLYRGLIWESLHQIAEEADSSPARVWSPWRTRWRRRKGRGKTWVRDVSAKKERRGARAGLLGMGRELGWGEKEREARWAGFGLGCEGGFVPFFFYFPFFYSKAIFQTILKSL